MCLALKIYQFRCLSSFLFAVHRGIVIADVCECLSMYTYVMRRLSRALSWFQVAPVFWCVLEGNTKPREEKREKKKKKAEDWEMRSGVKSARKVGYSKEAALGANQEEARGRRSEEGAENG